MTTANCEIAKSKTLKSFFTANGCSVTLMSQVDQALGHPMEAEERASEPLAGGVVQQGYQCGQLWGAALAAGAEAHRRHGTGPRAEAAAVEASRRCLQAFRAANDEINCLELTETDWFRKGQMLKYMVTGRAFRCAGMAMQFAPVACRTIQEALDEEPPEVSSPCASCAAKLARMMGASEQHVVMAAGLAAGIGLSGGGCGALGAAIWLTALDHPDEGLSFTPDNERASALIERFLVVSGYGFECASIVGRTFEDVEDHARYVEQGGCARLLEALAATVVTEEIEEQNAA
jgi:Putative redox-active protein (C_GCAxxG_C_C)